MKEKNEKIKANRWEKLSDLHPLIIIFFIIAILALLTYFIPGGEYARHQVAIGALGGDTRDVIDPNSFHYTASNPQGLGDLWTAFYNGCMNAADISFLIMICAGAFTAIIATGAITNGINSLVKKFGTKSYIIIPVCVYAFGLAAATAGIYEEATPFILVIVPLVVSMGFDSMVGVMTVHFSVAVGASVAFINPYNIGVGQALAQVPMLSGVGVRFVMWFIMMGLTSAYILRYALKVKKHPELSPCYETDLKKREEYGAYELTELQGVGPRGVVVLLSTFTGLGVIVYGVMKQGWWFTEIGSVFLLMGVVIPLVGGLKVNEMISKFIEGMSTVLSAVLLISASRVITKILEDSNTMDTMLHGLSGALSDMPKVICVLLMFLVASIAMLFIQSSSGLAAALMPIMAPLSDLLKIPRQIAVSAYAMGTGTFGWVAPWDGINYAMCTMAGVDFFKYLKEAFKFVLIVYIPGCVVGLILMVLFNYGA